MTKRKAETSRDDWRKLGLNVPSQAKKHAKLPVPFQPTAKRSGDRVVLELPHPHKVTHPNGRTRNHKYRAAKVKEDRQLAKFTTMSMNHFGIYPWTRVRVDATFFGTKSDVTNLAGWLKSFIDGFADVFSNGKDKGYEFGSVRSDEDLRGRQFVRITFTRLD